MARQLPPSIKRFASFLPWALLGISALATLGAPLGIYSSHIERLTHFRLWWLLILLGLAIFFLRRRRLLITLLTLAIIAWSAWPLRIYYSAPPPPPSAQTTNPPLKLISWNLLWENPHKADALTWLQSQNADLILLTECTLEWQRALAPLQERYPHRIHSGRDGAEGMWLLSRFPLDPPDPEGIATNKPWISTIAHSPAGPIRVLGMHPRTPRAGARFDERNAQYDRAAAITSAAEIPVILMGDLNCTPFSPWFSRLLERGNLADTAWGHGLTGTWQGQVVRLPIDHILANNHFRVIERRVEPDFHGSDHRPISAVLAVQSAL